MPRIRVRSTRQSPCPAARDYSRAYLHHLVKADEMLGAMLLTMVNLAYYQELMAGARAAIAAGRFEDFRAETQAKVGARRPSAAVKYAPARASTAARRRRKMRRISPMTALQSPPLQEDRQWPSA